MIWWGREISRRIYISMLIRKIKIFEIIFIVIIHSQIEIKMEQELFLLRIISATSQFLSANIAVSSFFNCGL